MLRCMPNKNHGRILEAWIAVCGLSPVIFAVDEEFAIDLTVLFGPCAHIITNVIDLAMALI